VPALRAGAVMVALLTAAGCGAGTPVDQHRAIGALHALDVTGGVTVRVVRAAAPSVTVHAGRAVVDRVHTKVEGGVLHVGVQHGIVIGADPLRHVTVRVAVPRLDSVQVSNADDVDLSGIDSDSLTLRVRGAGDVTANGRVRHLTTDIAGVGDTHLAGLRARTARVSVHGAGDVDLDVSDRLDIEAHGIGTITYHGDPRVTQDVSGAASVRQAP